MNTCTIKINNTKKKLQLPFTIGSSLDDTIYINSDQLTKNHFYVFQKRNYLYCTTQDGKAVPSSLLDKKYGIKLLGVYTEQDKPHIKLIRTMCQIESQLPDFMKHCLLFNFKDKIRVGYISFLLFSTLLITMNYQKSKEHQISTKSNIIHTLKDGILNKSVFKQSYSYGVVFALNLNKSDAALPARLKFYVQGLSKEGNVIVKVNNHTVYISQKEANCIKRACTESAVINKEQTHPGINKIAFIHSNYNEPWALGYVKFEAYGPLTEVEKKQLELYLSSAKEKYQERNLSPYSAVLSKRYINRIHKLTENKYVSSEQQVRVLTLEKEINSYILDLVNTLWFHYDEYLRVKEYHKALNKLTEMQEFYPDSSTLTGRKIKKQIQYVKSLLGVSND